jgi:hypothetical protein
MENTFPIPSFGNTLTFPSTGHIFSSKDHLILNIEKTHDTQDFFIRYKYRPWFSPAASTTAKTGEIHTARPPVLREFIFHKTDLFLDKFRELQGSHNEMIHT